MTEKSVNRFFLQATAPQVQFRKFYPGLSMLGRHFTIRNAYIDQVTRQYTICNVLGHCVLNEILKLIKPEDGAITETAS